MSVMDCQSFDSSLLDALYDELDAPTSAAMDTHASSCASCASQLERMSKTRALLRPALEAGDLPNGLEDRILAAAHAVMDEAEGAPAKANEAIPEVTHLADRRSKPGIVAFLSRPQFAIAATFLLVLGAAAILINTSTARDAPSAAAQAEPASASELASISPNGNQAQPPVAQATAAPMGSTYAMASPGAAAPEAPAPPLNLSARPSAAKTKGALGDEGRPTDPSGDPSAPTLAAAKSLYDAGRYAEALPRFDALAASSAEAELYAARCILNTRGCAAAVPRYDNVARRSPGTENGSRAALEAARCVNRTGQVAAARTRYKTLTNDNYVAAEANAELDALEAPKATVRAKPATPPAATATARTQALEPADPAR